METSLRMILLLVGMFIVAGIIWDTVRARKKARNRQITSPKYSGSRNEEHIISEDIEDPFLEDVIISKRIIPAEELRAGTQVKSLSEKKLENAHNHPHVNSKSINANSSNKALKSSKSILQGTLKFESYPDPKSQTKDFANSSSSKENVEKNAKKIDEDFNENANFSRNMNQSINMNQTTNMNRIEQENRIQNEFEFNNKAPVVLYLVANPAETFSGKKLLDAFLDLHLYYGEMQIFHYHENSDGTGDVMFSVASAVEPGYFDISKMDSFATPGISLFFIPSYPNQSIAAFEMMLRVARQLAQRLKGELLDEDRKIITLQSIERYRERVRIK